MKMKLKKAEKVGTKSTFSLPLLSLCSQAIRIVGRESEKECWSDFNHSD